MTAGTQRTVERPHSPSDLHGNTPDRCEVALLLIDVINDFEFERGDQLLKAAYPAARALAELKQRATRAGVPCIYANDNFGRWRSDFAAQVRHVREERTRGAKIAELLAPSKQDYFVLKPKHSAFYETCLGLLLDHLGVRTLVLGGFATDSCVSITANDAYLRGFGLYIVADASAALTRAAHLAALQQMERVLHARIARCRQISFVRHHERVSVRMRTR